MPKAYFNPFYLLSVIIGIAFLLTATAYGVMAFRGAAPHLTDGDESSVMVFLSRHGDVLFLVELGLLMATTIAAVATDDYWTKKPETKNPETSAGDGDDAAPADESNADESNTNESQSSDDSPVA